MKKKLLFSIPKKDLRIEYFRASGKGGQKVNKTSSACRITHIPSKAVGESQEERHQYINRKRALQKLVHSDKFKNWARVQAAMVEQGYRDLNDKVDQSMSSRFLKVEYITKFVCDKCHKRQEYISDTPQPSVPEGWLAVGDTKHYCVKCRSS